MERQGNGCGFKVDEVQRIAPAIHFLRHVVMVEEKTYRFAFHWQVTGCPLHLHPLPLGGAQPMITWRIFQVILRHVGQPAGAIIEELLLSAEVPKLKQRRFGKIDITPTVRFLPAFVEAALQRVFRLGLELTATALNPDHGR